MKGASNKITTKRRNSLRRIFVDYQATLVARRARKAKGLKETAGCHFRSLGAREKELKIGYLVIPAFC